MLTQPLSLFGVGYLLCFQHQLRFFGCTTLRGRQLASLSIEAERTIFELSDPALNRDRTDSGLFCDRVHASVLRRQDFPQY